jgi:hypothetical protein
MVVCALVIVILVGIADVFYSHLFSQPSYIWLSLLCFSSLSTPLLYSFSSLIGVFLLLLSVPLGFSKMFDIFSKMLIKQKTTPPVSNNQNGRLDFPTMTAEKCLNNSIISSIILQFSDCKIWQIIVGKTKFTNLTICFSIDQQLRPNLVKAMLILQQRHRKHENILQALILFDIEYKNYLVAIDSGIFSTIANKFLIFSYIP